MSRADGDRGATEPERMIHEMQRYIKEVRRAYIDEMGDAGLTTATRRELAKAAVKYWDMLHEYRDESVLSDDDFPDISPIEQRLGAQVETDVPSKRRSQQYELGYRPAIDELDPNYCIEVTRQLDRCAKKLGFGAAVENQLSSFGVDPDWEE